MSEELVKFKGNAAGLQLMIAAGADTESVLNELRDKLESEWGSRFFRRGTLVLLMPGVISPEDEERFTKLFRQHGVFFRVEDAEAELREARARQAAYAQAVAVPQPPVESVPVAAPEPVNVPAAQAPTAVPFNANEVPQPLATAAEPGTVPMKVINRTVRSGESISSRGGVLIVGNVNAGAEIVAGGSIDIRGVCKGLVHAGAYGDRNAVIVADCLMPVQIRIADIIAQSPEGMARPTKAERAQIKDNAIVIETIER
ncbi:MAG: septum site-determining protein MinC [Selenomonadaceae bacterium]|nr:septum site-determining protein MinC [Selenomonadaceae bacterium]